MSSVYLPILKAFGLLIADRCRVISRMYPNDSIFQPFEICSLGVDASRSSCESSYSLTCNCTFSATEFKNISTVSFNREALEA